MTRWPMPFAHNCKAGCGNMQRGFVGEILAAYGDLRASVRRQVDFHPREATITAYIMFGSFAIFLGFLPRLFATDLSGNVEQSLAAGVIVWFFIVMFFLPLAFYSLSALSHLIAKRSGGQGSFYSARVAFGWMVVVLAPLVLIKSIIGTALIHSAPIFLPALNLGLLAIAIWIWSNFIAETENFRRPVIISTSMAAILAAVTVSIYLLGRVTL